MTWIPALRYTQQQYLQGHGVLGWAGDKEDGGTAPCALLLVDAVWEIWLRLVAVVILFSDYVSGDHSKPQNGAPRVGQRVNLRV